MGRIIICAALIAGIALAICWRHQHPLLAGEGTITAAQLEDLQARHRPVGLRAVHVAEHRITSLLPNPGADEIWFTTHQGGLFAFQVRDQTTRTLVGNTDSRQVLVSPSTARAGIYAVRELLGDLQEARMGGRPLQPRYQLVTGEQTTVIETNPNVYYSEVEYVHPAGLLLWRGTEGLNRGFIPKMIFAVTDLQGNRRLGDLQFPHTGEDSRLRAVCSDDGKYLCLVNKDPLVRAGQSRARIYGMDGTGQQLWRMDAEPMASSTLALYFSPDGTRLFVFFAGSGVEPYYQIIQMPTGEILANHPIENFYPSGFRQLAHRVGLMGFRRLLLVNLIDGQSQLLYQAPWPFIMRDVAFRSADNVIYALVRNSEGTELRLYEIRPEHKPFEIGQIQVQSVYLGWSPLLRVTDTDDIYLAGDNVIWKVVR